jgi:ferric-dicitrate binding protein FerR (iron transport regulator)
MTISEIVAIAAVVLSVGTNVALYVHLSSTVNTRFDSVERRLELVQGALHGLDVRLTKMER